MAKSVLPHQSLALCLLSVVWLTFIPHSQCQLTTYRATTTVDPIRDALHMELIRWDMTSSTFYESCDVESHCIGLPLGCLAFRHCEIIAEITPPNVTDPNDAGDYRFKMQVILPKNALPNEWLSIGLNKELNEMGNASVVTCLFWSHNMYDIDSFTYGWTNGREGVVPVLNDPTTEIKHFTSYRDEPGNGDTFLKCGFYRIPETKIKIDTSVYPGLPKETEFDLRRDSYHPIMAYGDIAKYTQGGHGKDTVELKAHVTEHAAAEELLRLRAGVCGKGVACLGTGPDGCGTVTEDCPLMLRSTRTQDVLLVEIESKYEYAYHALLLSNTINVTLADSKIFFAAICDPTPTKYSQYGQVYYNNIKDCKWENSSSPGSGRLTCHNLGGLVEDGTSPEFNGTLASIPILRKNVFYHQIHATLDILKFDELPDNATQLLPDSDAAKIKLILSQNASGSGTPDIALFCMFHFPRIATFGGHQLGTRPYFYHLFAGNDTNMGENAGKLGNNLVFEFTRDTRASSRRSTEIDDGKYADFLVLVNRTPMEHRTQTGGDKNFENGAETTKWNNLGQVWVMMIILQVSLIFASIQ